MTAVWIVVVVAVLALLGAIVFLRKEPPKNRAEVRWAGDRQGTQNGVRIRSARLQVSSRKVRADEGWRDPSWLDRIREWFSPFTVGYGETIRNIIRVENVDTVVATGIRFSSPQPAPGMMLLPEVLFYLPGKKITAHRQNGRIVSEDGEEVPAFRLLPGEFLFAIFHEQAQVPGEAGQGNLTEIPGAVTGTGEQEEPELDEAGLRETVRRKLGGAQQ
mgnify:CR=1 FL=1